MHAYKGAESTKRRTADNKLGFVNLRSAAYWAFREALNPDQPGGSPVALPPDQKLYAELTTPVVEVVTRGIKVEPKEDVCARLGRSPDHADAAVMAWSGGPSYTTHGNAWREAAKMRKAQWRWAENDRDPYGKPRPRVLRW